MDAPDGWELAWHDEFEGPDIDGSIWTPHVGAGGFGNNEAQFYTDHPANARIENGRLVIEARAERRTDSRYTSAKLLSRGKRSLLYGRVEARARVPRGVGSWPAIWMMPEDDHGYGGGWPDAGELDIMEHVGHNRGVVHFSMHTAAFNHVINTQKTAVVAVPDAMDAFHVYGLEWDPERITFLLDGRPTLVVPNPHASWREWPFDKPFHLILNVAVGGNWGGAKGIDESSLPWRMEVDWVRVYRREQERE